MLENEEKIKTRRQFLKSALTGAGLGAVVVLTPQIGEAFLFDPCDFGEGNAARKDFLGYTAPLKAGDLYGSILGSRQYTMYGDTNHTDLRPARYFYGERNQQMMVEAGIKHVFIEHPVSIQPLLDRVAEGKIDRPSALSLYSDALVMFWVSDKDKATYLGDVIDFTKNMAQHGIKVHCVDKFDDDLSTGSVSADVLNRFRSVTEDLRNYKAQTCPAAPVLHERLSNAFNNRRYFLKALLGKYPGRDPMAGEADIMSERQKDQGLAKRIQAIAGNEKAAIFYGAAHGNDKSENDLDTLLGQSRVLRIDLVGNKDSFLDPLSYMAWGREDYHEPHFIHLIEEDIAYKTFHGQEVFPDQKTSKNTLQVTSIRPA